MKIKGIQIKLHLQIRLTLAEYFYMATATLVPSAMFPLHTVLIMKIKLEQHIKAEMQAKNFKQWILKRILKTIL